MGKLRNIACECIMTDGNGNEYPAKLFISDADTDGIFSKRNEDGKYDHELNLKPVGYEITIFDGVSDEENVSVTKSSKPKVWTIK